MVFVTCYEPNKKGFLFCKISLVKTIDIQYFKIQVFFKFSVKQMFCLNFPVSSLSLIIYSYTENPVKMACKDIHKQFVR